MGGLTNVHIMLIERVVERCNDPSSSDYLKAKNMSAKIVDDYESNVIPRKGEIIFISDDKIYEVLEVIYLRHGVGSPGRAVISVHIEVKPHKARHTYHATNHSFEEEWPLITNMPADLSWFYQDENDEDSQSDEFETCE